MVAPENNFSSFPTLAPAFDGMPAEPEEMNMGQNWNEMNGAKMMNEIFDFIVANNMTIIYLNCAGDDPHDEDHHELEDGMTESHLPDPEKYPWIARFAPSSCACRSPGCGCLRRLIPWRALHLHTWHFFNGVKNPREIHQLVHHKNLDKHDARLKNLGKGTRGDHCRAHNMRRQKFGYLRRKRLVGFYTPHQPARVVSRPEMIGMVVPLSETIARAPSKAMMVRQLLDRLRVRWEPLSAEMAHLDSGDPIPRGAPRAAWNAPATRMLGIRMPKLEIAPGEAVFILLLVKHGFDMDAAAADAGEPCELLRLLWERPAVSVAITRWRNQRRLPLFK